MDAWKIPPMSRRSRLTTACSWMRKNQDVTLAIAPEGYRSNEMFMGDALTSVLTKLATGKIVEGKVGGDEFKITVSQQAAIKSFIEVFKTGK